MNRRKAVVLLSGGVDSTTVLAYAIKQGFEVAALSFSYGQRHAIELDFAQKVSRFFNVADHRTANIDLRIFGGSALTADIDVPKNRAMNEIETGIPITYVPARNTIFLSFALGFAETIGARDIFIGVNALDYSGYPDCRPEYIKAFQTLADLATKAGVEAESGEGFTIHTPLISMSKAEIIRLGHELGVDYNITLSCYDPSPEGKACGRCDSCLLRQKGFEEAGLKP